MNIVVLYLNFVLAFSKAIPCPADLLLGITRMQEIKSLILLFFLGEDPQTVCITPDPAA